MADVMVDGSEQTAFNYNFGAKQNAKISDYYFPVVRSYGGLAADNPHHGVSEGSAHVLRLDAGHVMSGHVTTHPFSGSANMVWYSFAHYARDIVNAEIDDDVFITHFTQTNPETTTIKRLCVTALVTALGPTKFKYHVRREEFGVGLADLSPDVISGEFSLSSTAHNWIQVQIDASATPNDITLWVNDASFGPGDTGSANWKDIGGYMLEDTQTAAGKGASIGAWYFDNRICNDDVAGTGFTSRPPSTWSGPPGP